MKKSLICHSRENVYQKYQETMHPAVVPPTPTEPAMTTTAATFQINTTKRYFPVVNFPIKNNLKFLENLKKELKKNNLLEWNIDLKKQYN